MDRTGTMTFKSSYSALDTFESCAAKYNFKYNLKLPDASGPAADRGTRLHTKLEDHLIRDAKLDTMFAAKPALASHIAEIKAHNGKTLQCEQRWMVRRDWARTTDKAEQWVVAKLDYFYQPSPTVAVVGDWKSGRVYPKHVRQTRMYAAMAWAQVPALQTVHTELVYLDARQIRDDTYQAAQLPGIQKEFNDAFGIVERATKFPASPSPLCAWCNYSQTKGGPCKAG